MRVKTRVFLLNCGFDPRHRPEQHRPEKGPRPEQHRPEKGHQEFGDKAQEGPTGGDRLLSAGSSPIRSKSGILADSEPCLALLSLVTPPYILFIILT